MPAGRPTTYRPEYAEQARKLCRNGATDREVADILGICVRTFYRWRAEHRDFAEALVDAKEFADDRVERALYQRACGYEYDDVKIFHPANPSERVIMPISVHVPADVGAAKQWLANRRPRLWASEKGARDDALRFKEAVAAGVAQELARRGLQA